MTERPLAPRPGHVAESSVVDFDIYAPDGHEADYHEAWRALLREDVPEMVWTPRNGGHWIATRAAPVREIFQDYTRFSSRVRMVPRNLFEGMRMIPETLDPPEHRPYRLLLSLSLSPRRIMAMDEKMRATATDLILTLRERGHCEFTRDFAGVFPLHIFLGLVDLPISDATRLRALADAIMRPDGTRTPDQVYQDLRDYLAPHVQARRQGNGDDLLSAIANGTIEQARISEQEAIMMAAQVVLGGIDTVGNFLSFVILFLARNPAARQELVRSPELMPQAVEEFFRRFGNLFLGREVTSDLRYRGVEMKAGDMVIMPTMLHGLDKGEHENPFAVSFHREKTSHSAFGNGNHLCPGAYLARAEVRIAIEEWLRHIPDFSIRPDTPIHYLGGLGGTVAQLPIEWT